MPLFKVYDTYSSGNIKTVICKICKSVCYYNKICDHKTESECQTNRGPCGIYMHFLKDHPNDLYRCKKCNEPFLYKSDVKDCDHGKADSSSECGESDSD